MKTAPSVASFKHGIKLNVKEPQSITTLVPAKEFYEHDKKVLAIRRIFSLVDIITNTKFSNCANVFKIGVVQQ